MKSRIFGRMVMAAAIAIAVTACASKEDRIAEHLKKSRDYLAQQDYDKAGVEARNAMQIDPKRAEPYFIAAQIDEVKQDWQRAFGGYTKVIELDPGHVDAKVRLARLYLAARDQKNAEQRISEVLSAQPDNLEARSLRSALLAGQGDLQGAAKEARDVLAKNPGQPEAAAILANLEARNGDVTKAVGTLEAAIKANPKNIDLRIAYGQMLARAGDRERLEKNYLDMIEVAPKRTEFRTALAGFYVQTGQDDKAEKTLRDSVAADKDDEQRRLALVDFLQQRRGADVAENELRQMLSEKPKAYAIKFRLAQLLNQTGRPQDADKLYAEVIDADKTGPSGLQARTFLAANHVLAGRRDEAEKLLNEVLKENPRDNRALLFRAQLNLAKKDPANAIIDLRSVIKDQPGSPQVVGLLANAHRLNNEASLGREVISNALALYPDNVDLKLLLADYLASTNDPEGALRELDDVIKRQPRLVRAYEAKAALYTMRKDAAGAERTLQALKSALPDNPVGPYRLGLLYASQRKTDAAIKEFEAALARAPNSPEPVTALIATYASQGRLDQALARASEAARQQPKSFIPQVMMGDVYAAQKRFPDAENAYRKAMQLAPKSPAPYMGLARMYGSQGAVDKAMNVLLEGQKVVPNDQVLGLALAETYQRSGSVDKAVTEYEGLLKRNPANEIVANNLAYLLAQRGDKPNLDRALSIANRFEGAQQPAFLDTLGWIHYLRGEYDQAVTLLRKASELAPQSAPHMYHLGAALVKSGKADEGKALIKRALDSGVAFDGSDDAKKLVAQ